MDSDPDRDLEIIDTTEIPTDPNTNTNASSPTSSDYGSDEIPGGGLDAVRESEKMLQSFLPVEDTMFTDAADEITKPTDLTTHNKTKSETTGGFDMLNFFRVEGDTPSEDEEIDATKSKESRALSMAAMDHYEIDPQNELNFENLRMHSEQDAAAHDIDEEKTAQPLDIPSDQSNHGSEHSKQELNVEDHLDPNNTVEERIEPITNDANGWPPDEDPPHYNYDHPELSADTTPGIPDDPTMITEPPDPRHIKRPSIQDLVAAELANDPEIREMSAQLQQDRSANMTNMMSGGGIDHLGGMMNGVDATSGGMDYYLPSETPEAANHDNDLMVYMRKFAEKERNYKETIRDLEEELDDMEQSKKEMEIEYEKRLSIMEEKESEMKEAFEKEIDELKTNHVTERERVMSDNHTMAQDINMLRQEVQSHKQQMDDLQSQLADAQSAREEARIQWEVHRDQCPLLNDEVARQIAEEKNKEIQKWKMGSQAMDEELAKMLTTEKEMVDDIERLKEENQNKKDELATSNLEIARLQEHLEKLKAEHHQNTGALQETRLRADQEQTQRLELEQQHNELLNQYDMLYAYSHEQAQVLEQMEPPLGVDPQEFEAVKTKKALFRPSNAGGGKNQRSIVNSIGGLHEYVEHVRKLSNMSEQMRSGVFYDEKDDVSDIASQYSTASSAWSQAPSHFSRYSFRPYHVHDATREFFFLLSLCVKLSLAHKYGISPDVAPNNDALWSQALQQNIKFHEYPEFLQNELSNLYEYKFKARQGTIHNVVITDVTKIREKKELNVRVKDLERKMENQSYLYSQYENYTKGSGSVENRFRAVKDRTYFSPNDDLFGGHTKVTTRAHRELRMQSARSRSMNKSISSNRSARNRSDRDRHRHSSSSHHHHKDRKRKSRKSGTGGSSSREPGNRKDAQNHPLNAAHHGVDDKRRDSGKLSSKPMTPSGGGGGGGKQQRQRRHLTQESLDHLDPNKNPKI